MAGKKRVSTWGSKRKRGENSWELSYPLPNGKRGYQSFRGTAKEADRELANLRVKYEGAQPDITLDQFWNEYYSKEAENRLAKTTWDGYKNVYPREIQPVFGDTPLKDISAREIQTWLSGMTHGKAVTAKRLLSAMLSRAFTLELVDDNVAQRRFILPKEMMEQNTTKETYTIEELDEIFNACRGEQWEAYFIMAAFGGAMRSEAGGVLASEVDLLDDYAIVPISRGVHVIKGEVVVQDHTKNEFRKDNLIIRPPYSLRLYKLSIEAMKRGDKWLTDNGAGYPSSPALIVKKYERWFQRQPVRYIPFRNLRNTFSTTLHAMGLEDSTISKLMRHANLTTDYNHYNRISPKDLTSLIGSYRQFDKNSDAYRQ